MKNPKGSYNDDALNDLLKQYMLDEAARDRSADEWLETEAEAVFASEPEYQPSKERERALVADLNAKLTGAGNKGGSGLIWKGSAMGLLLVAGLAAFFIWAGPEEEYALGGQNQNDNESGFETAPYYDGSGNSSPNNPAEGLLASNTLVPDTILIAYPSKKHTEAVVEIPDTVVAFVSPTAQPARPKQQGKTLIKELKRKLELFMEQFPAERVYAQTDRTDYVPGQTVWFSAYLLNEGNLKPSNISDIIKSELLNSNGEAIVLKEWTATNGRVSGYLTIPQDLASGTYLFRAYTAWQHYLPGSKIFEAPIVVQQPGQGLHVEDVAQLPGAQPTIEFFPEGGDLVAGLQSRVAFRVPHYFGNIKGSVVDENGTAITTFQANADGQGIFAFTPQADHQYFAQAGGFHFKLPAIYPDGYVLEVLGQEANWVNINLKSTKENNVVLVGQLRGTMYYGAEHELQPGDNLIKIPVNNLPAGVLHLSLFDTDGIGHAERLVFVNKQKQLHISIKTDKDNYLPREKVTAHITVTDAHGKPLQTTLSLSAMDDLLTHTQNTNILSALLLEPDLGAVAGQAGYLFDPANKNADKELDLLLMTQGWRRFTWKEVYYNLRQPVAMAPENAVLKGKVIDAATQKPLKDVKITNKLLGIKTTTAADGSFHIPNIDLSQVRELDFSYKIGLMTMVVNRYQNDLVVEFSGDARRVFQPQPTSKQHPILTGKQKAPKGTAVVGQVINAYGNGIAGATVILTATNGTAKQVKTDAQGYYSVITDGAGSYTVTVNAIGYNPYGSHMLKAQANKLSMLDVLLHYQVDMARLPAHFTHHEADAFANRYGFLANKFLPAYNNPVEETGKTPFTPDIRPPLRDGVTAYYVEGMKMKYNEPLMLPLSAIGHVEVFDNGLPSKYNDAGTVMEVTTGTGSSLQGSPKAPEDKPLGFYVRYAQPKEYPKTQYGVRDRVDERTDLRSTLYWNGNITTDGNGKATIEFYASDDLSAFRLVAEGIGTNGLPGRTEQVVGMQWPFNLQVQMPQTLKKGEKIQVPIWVENYTGKQVTGSFDFTLPTGLKPIWPLAPKEHGLFPGRNDTIMVQLEVIDPTATGTMIVGFTASGYRDVFTYQLPPVGRKD